MVEVKNFGLAGVGNVPFSDVERALQSKAGAITKILVGHGDVVDSIQAFNENISMPKHGGNGGTITEVNFTPDDPLLGIMGFTGNYFGANHVLQITLLTKSGKQYGPFGTTRFASSEFKFMADVNNPVMAFYGSSYIHTDGTNFISSIGIASINI